MKRSAAVLLSLLLASVGLDVRAGGPSDGAAAAVVDPAVADEEFQRLLESYAPDTTSELQQKSAEYHALQEKFDAKLASMQNVRTKLQNELGNVKRHLGTDVTKDHTEDDESASSAVSPTLEAMYDDMETVGSKTAELMRRTEAVLEKVGEYNLKALRGELGEEDADASEDAPNDTAGAKHPAGLQSRLDHILAEEMRRRERYNASVEALVSSQKMAASEESDATTTEEEESAPVPSNATTSKEDAPSPYINLDDLAHMLSPQNVILLSELTLQQSLTAMANERMHHHMTSDNKMWKDRLQAIPRRYQEQFLELEQQIKEATRATHEGKCLGVPRAVEIVGKALQEHYYDGIDMVDHAQYEGGGSVAYDLTSSPYVPPPRNDDEVERMGRTSAAYDMVKQQMFDEQMKEMYHEGRTMKKRGLNGDLSLMDQLGEAAERADVWEWYTTFKFESLRQHLPDDWERALDTFTHGSWSDYTPRGAVDHLVPDYVIHSLGMSHDPNFGSAFGRTAGPEVAISAGYATGGRAAGVKGGGTAKQLGQCYPLSMRAEDDPALSLLSLRDEEIDASLLAGPKFTVRLPYPVRIDAVTLEHRSFPLPKQMLENGARGGESAPRWVRAVGFPPCPKGIMTEEQEEECALRGFDVTDPVDLGSFEYQRITVTGREDDYGGSDDDEEEDVWGDRRRRSVQTFAVKGGKWKPSSLLSDDEQETIKAPYDSRDPRQCDEGSGSCGAPPTAEPEEESSLPEPGQCAPPKDEDSEPSCGGEESSSSSPSVERHVVEAVSFVIEENWGNPEYTCLYRVRVHGDAV